MDQPDSGRSTGSDYSRASIAAIERRHLQSAGCILARLVALQVRIVFVEILYKFNFHADVKVDVEPDPVRSLGIGFSVLV